MWGDSTNIRNRLCNYRKEGLRVLLFICMGGIALISPAQDVHLSQFFNSPLLRNPALAGLFTGDVRVQAVYRNQWQSTGFPYQTNALSGEYKFPVGNGDDFMTVGASVFYDQAGIMKLKTLQAMPAINFHKSLSGNKNSFLSGGFMAGIINRQFDGKNLTFDNQYTGSGFNPSAASGEQFTGVSRSLFDISAGLSYNSEIGENGNYYFGASLWHFHKPVTGLLSNQIQLDPKWQFNAGLKTPLNEEVTLTVEANYLQQGKYSETVGGVLVQYVLDSKIYSYGEETSIQSFSVGGGLFARLNDAIIPYVQLTYNHIDIGISYDVNTSPLKAASQGRGGFEFSLTYRGFSQYRGSRVRSMLCPRF